MKALLLAAGRGTRISRYLSGMPKCTVDIGGERLIRYTVELLRDHGIREIGIVLGYRQEVIREVLSGLNVVYFYNPFFDVTNSIASVWFAKSFLGGYGGNGSLAAAGGDICRADDMMLMNADVYIDGHLLDMIMSEQRSPVMFADETRRETADYKFYFENHILKKYGKDLEGDDISGEYIGIARFGRGFTPQFVGRMEQMIGEQKHSLWWENVLYELSGEQDIYVQDVQGEFWAEVDYIEDYERILRHRGAARAGL